MKRILPILVFLMLAAQLMAQGWRPGQSEVMVTLRSPEEAQQLTRLGLDWEPASSDGRLARVYAVPSDLRRMEAAGIRYRVTIADLNSHYAHYWDNPAVPPGYYTYDQIISIIDSLATHFPSICRKEMWGTSMGNRQLAALKISDNVSADETEAEILFDGGIHGDEVGGAQNMIMFARDLCLAYGTDPQITNLIDNREIWIYPMVNPDGRVSMSRYNNNSVDLNRDWGYMWNAEGSSTDAFSQIETKALRNAMIDNQFVVYSNYHSGTEIISYPWSYRSSACKDMEHIDFLASKYAQTSGYSSLPYGQGYNIMYAINGSGKDSQYGIMGNVGWSIEISMDKQPPSSQIGYFYSVNKPSMLEIIDRCAHGIQGMVTDSVTGAPVSASVWVQNFFPVYSDPVVGDFHKYLMGGNYTVKVMANGYETRTITGVTVPADGTATLSVQLAPVDKWYAFKVMSCRIPGNNFGDEGNTPGALRRPDSVVYSMGRYGWIVLDMKDTIFDGPGNDFKIYQYGTTPKSITVSGGNSKDGPFTTIGSAMGTSGFDIGPVGLNRVRYLYLKDGGTGPSSGAGAGYNLDAVEMITPPMAVNISASTTTPCAGTTVDFTDLSTGNPSQWNWTFPGAVPSASTDRNPQDILYPQSGFYDVMLTISNGITPVSRTFQWYINPLYTPVVALGADTAICAWSAITLDAGNTGTSYLWSTGATNRTIVADSAGTGFGFRDYWVEVSNNDGCTGTDTIRITFENCTSAGSVAQDRPLWLSPNPAVNRILLHTGPIAGGDWSILSIAGEVVRSGKLDSVAGRTGIDVSALPRGVYLVRLHTEQHTEILRLILQPEGR